MPVDPVILHKYDRPAPPPRPRRDGPAALVTATIGTLVSIVAFALADGRPGAIQFVVLLTTVFAVTVGAALLYIGYQDSGLIGALYEYRHPLGAEFSGEAPKPWIRYAVGWVLLLLCIVCVALMARTPGAIPDSWLGRTRPQQTWRDTLLK